MKRILTIAGVLFFVVLLSCSKSTTTPNENGTPLKFESLVVQDSVIKVNAITNVTANATGDGLTFKWSASYGTFIGSGSAVKWTVCHMDKFSITCVVTDKNNNSLSKTVYIRTID